MYEGRVLLLQSILQQGAASGPGVMDRPRAVVARSVRTKWHRQTRHIHGLCSAISPAVQRSTGREGLPARLRPRTQIYSPKVALQRRGREPEGVFGLRGSQTGRERRPSRRRFVLRMCAAVKETQPMANAPRSPVLDRPGGAALLPPVAPKNASARSSARDKGAKRAAGTAACRSCWTRWALCTGHCLQNAGLMHALRS